MIIGEPNRLLVNESLAKYNWFSLSSTSNFSYDRSRPHRLKETVTVAIVMPDPTVHYSSRIVVTADRAVVSTSQSEVPLGVPTASISGLQSSGSSPGERGPKTADKDLGEVIRQLFLEQGLRIMGYFLP